MENSNIKIINPYIKTYLVGPMEKTLANDSGRGWRDKIRPELENRIDINENPIYVFDPTREEQSKVGMEAKEFHKKMHGWIEGGNKEQIIEGTNLIWRGKTYQEPLPGSTSEARLVHLMGDIDYVLNSDFIICRMEEGDQPCGTHGEVYEAFKNRIPVYIIQTMTRDKYPVTFVGWVFASGGGFFDNPTQLLEFLDRTYKLKVKKEEKPKE